MRKFIVNLLFIGNILYMPHILAAATCQINSVSTLNFGDINTIDGLTDTTTSTINVSCNDGTGTYTLSFNAGNSNDMTNRSLKHTNNTDTMLYNFYKNPDYTGILGDGTGGTEVISKNFVDNQTDDITIYARILPQPTSPVGTYSETAPGITITLTY